jgi:uncharacterized protein (DUF1697 family)
MTVWIALLRGVNVGGDNKLPMADFRAMLGDIGLGSVATYIQSGTAVFSSDLHRENLGAVIASGIETNFGFRPDVILRTLPEFRAALDNNPFPQAAAEPKTLHLFFLSEPVPVFDATGLKAFATNGEEFHLAETVLYIYTPNGFGRSKIGEKLGRFFKTPITGATCVPASKYRNSPPRSDAPCTLQRGCASSRP